MNRREFLKAIPTLIVAGKALIGELLKGSRLPLEQEVAPLDVDKAAVFGVLTSADFTASGGPLGDALVLQYGVEIDPDIVARIPFDSAIRKRLGG